MCHTCGLSALLDFCLELFGDLQLPLSEAVLSIYSGGLLVGFCHSKYHSVVGCRCHMLSFLHSLNEYLMVVRPFMPVETQDLKSHAIFEFDFVVGHV